MNATPASADSTGLKLLSDGKATLNDCIRLSYFVGEWGIGGPMMRKHLNRPQ